MKIASADLSEERKTPSREGGMAGGGRGRGQKRGGAHKKTSGRGGFFEKCTSDQDSCGLKRGEGRGRQRCSRRKSL